MYREIGSEFWDVPIGENENRLFPETTKWFESGRSALTAIISSLSDCHTVAMPSWCCDSMIKPFADAGYRIIFYPVYFNKGLVQELNRECDVLFLIDYFGYTASKVNLNGYKGVVIRDVTHSIFSQLHEDADYYFGSLRKWCGIWTGGYAWEQKGDSIKPAIIQNGEFVRLRKTAMEMKKAYIEGRGNKGYLELFKSAEISLEKEGVFPSTDRDIRAARYLDIEDIRQSRRNNAKILMRDLNNWLIFSQMADDDCPMFVPVLVPNAKRNELRKYLIRHDIYCPVHWPLSENQRVDVRTEELYRNELSLVCDQRYAEDDMHRIIDAIKAFMEGNDGA